MLITIYGYIAEKIGQNIILVHMLSGNFIWVKFLEVTVDEEVLGV